MFTVEGRKDGGSHGKENEQISGDWDHTARIKVWGFYVRFWAMA